MDHIKGKLKHIVDILSILIVGVAIAVLGGRLLFGGAHLGGPPSDHVPSGLIEFSELLSSGHWTGPRSAPVVAVVFSTYECGFCADLKANLDILRHRYPQHLAVVWKSAVSPSRLSHYMVPLGVECAADQERFEEYHMAAFENARVLSYTEGWRILADSARIPDLSEFEACVRSLRYAERISEEFREAKRLGVSGTPTLFINGAAVVGAPSLEGLDTLVAIHFRDRGPREARRGG